MPAAVDQQPVHIPLSSQFDRLFHSQGKVESAQDRLNLASEAEKLIPQHLLIGWGSGVEFQYYEAGVRRGDTIAYAHNIVLDLWLRLGLIGLVLFVIAMALLARRRCQGMAATSRSHRGGLGPGIVVVLGGLLATAFLEPFLDEYRLATLFGVTPGHAARAP